MEKDAYTIKEAAEYLGMHKQNIEAHQRSGKLVPDFKFQDGSRMYSAETLRTYQVRWQSNMLTMREIGELFKIPKHRVFWAFRQKRAISPDGKRGKADVYSDAKIMMVGSSERWFTSRYEEAIGVTNIGYMFLTESKEWVVYHRENSVLSILNRCTTEETARIAFNERREQLRALFRQGLR